MRNPNNKFKFVLYDAPGFYTEYRFWHGDNFYWTVRDNEPGWEEFGYAAFLGRGRNWTEAEAAQLLEQFNAERQANHEAGVAYFHATQKPEDWHFIDEQRAPKPVQTVYWTNDDFIRRSYTIGDNDR